jgi:hypothetical protein
MELKPLAPENPPPLSKRPTIIKCGYPTSPVNARPKYVRPNQHGRGGRRPVPSKTTKSVQFAEELEEIFWLPNLRFLTSTVYYGACDTKDHELFDRCDADDSDDDFNSFCGLDAVFGSLDVVTLPPKSGGKKEENSRSVSQSTTDLHSLKSDLPLWIFGEHIRVR